ncbi:MAG: hypothetical protein IKO32_10175 [Lachnospiraceae bacterium]|nr:hypothetical protein [Lachnospiraceae bacterium]
MDNKKIKRALDLYPIYEAMSIDLLFYSVIEILFLTLVKGYTDNQVALVFLITTVADLALEYVSYLIIKKIGNSASVIVGAAMPLLAILLITLGPHIAVVATGNILFVASGNFRSMGCAGARNNLSLIGEKDRFTRIFSVGNIIYAGLTMVSTLLMPMLFLYNRYLPSVLCAMAYTWGLITAFMMPDFSEKLSVKPAADKEKAKEIEWKRFSPMLKYLLFVFCLFFCTAVTFSQNSELMMSGTLKARYSENSTIIGFGLIILVSRSMKLVVNVFLPKILDGLKEKVILVGAVTLFAASLITAAAGFFFKNTFIGIVMMAVVYILMCMIWDPMRTFLRMAAVDTNSRNKQQTMLVLLNVGQSVINVFMRLIVFLMLRRFTVEYVFPFFAAVSVVIIILSARLAVKCRESIELLNIETELTAEELDNIASTIYDLLIQNGLESKEAVRYRFLVEEKLLDCLENGDEKQDVRIVLVNKHDEVDVKLTVGGKEIDVFAIPQSGDKASSDIFGRLLGGL